MKTRTIAIEKCEYNLFEKKFDEIIKKKVGVLVNQGYRRNLKIGFFTFECEDWNDLPMEIFKGITDVDYNYFNQLD